MSYESSPSLTVETCFFVGFLVLSVGLALTVLSSVIIGLEPLMHTIRVITLEGDRVNDKG
jgi:hypothetical protein